MIINEKLLLLYMPEIPIELEYYPKLTQELLKNAVDKINENKFNWDDPFFMDVYGYSDLAHFKEICIPYLEDPNLKNLIILGTGGSYQTMKALSLFAKKSIHFLSSSRPHELSEVLFRTLPANSLVIPISRGGKTIDVNSILPLFKEYKILALSSQGPMNDMVKKFNATILPVPDLSGRFAASICSVMLVPALISGINVEQVQKGLEDGYALFKNLDESNFNLNSALQYAVFVYHLYKKGYRNIFSMPYSQWLEGLTGLLVQEISESMHRSQIAVNDIVAKSEMADGIRTELESTSESMSGVVQIIRDLAEQVNLLALNATIEAARAGDAGKGFAVVAGEVKNLATQTAKATDQIEAQINSMLSITKRVVDSTREISESAGSVSDYVNTVASAVEEQTSVTHDISKNIQFVFNGINELNSCVKSIAS